MQYIRNKNRGFTFVELLVTIGVLTIVFGGLMTAVQFTLKLIGISKATTSALSLANERIEYIRSLSYNDIGTLSGIPNGPIPQNSTSTLNGILFHERVLIAYVDSPDDGIGGADVNGILSDYKQIKVEYSWQSINGTSTIFLLTNVIPPGIETTAGGGTLTVNVFDAHVQPVSGASVRVYNNTTTSTIDTIRYTNSDGVAMFSGAPAAANYQITVTKTGYSTDQTYTSTTSNPNPTTLPVAVLESAVSTMNFQIDSLSDLTVRTFGESASGLSSDTFSDLTHIASSSSIDNVSDDIVLSGGAGSYALSGFAYATATTPGTITQWGIADWNATIPAFSDLKIHIYSVSGSVYTLIPDGILSGNSTGYTSGPIDLSGIDTVTYPSLTLKGELTTSDPNVTPMIHGWSLSYITSEPVIASVPFSLTSTKTIGTHIDTSPVYKYTASNTTDGTGEVHISGLEWGSYAVTLDTSAYNIKEACEDIPYALDPAVTDILKLTLVPATAHSVRVSVFDVTGGPLYNALVTVSRPGFTDSGNTSLCGQIYFGTGVTSNTDYTVSVQKSGFTTQTLTPVEVNGETVFKVILGV